MESRRLGGNAEAWVSTLQKPDMESRSLGGGNMRGGGDAVVGGDGNADGNRCCKYNIIYKRC